MWICAKAECVTKKRLKLSAQPFSRDLYLSRTSRSSTCRIPRDALLPLGCYQMFITFEVPTCSYPLASPPCASALIGPNSTATHVLEWLDMRLTQCYNQVRSADCPLLTCLFLHLQCFSQFRIIYLVEALALSSTWLPLFILNFVYFWNTLWVRYKRSVNSCFSAQQFELFSNFYTIF